MRIRILALSSGDRVAGYLVGGSAATAGSTRWRGRPGRRQGTGASALRDDRPGSAGDPGEARRARPARARAEGEARRRRPDRRRRDSREGRPLDSRVSDGRHGAGRRDVRAEDARSRHRAREAAAERAVAVDVAERQGRARLLFAARWIRSAAAAHDSCRL